MQQNLIAGRKNPRQLTAMVAVADGILSKKESELSQGREPPEKHVVGMKEVAAAAPRVAVFAKMTS